MSLIIICRKDFFLLHRSLYKATSEQKNNLGLGILSFIGWTTGAVIAYGIAYTSVSMGHTQMGELISRVLIALESSVSVPICSIALFYSVH